MKQHIENFTDYLLAWYSIWSTIQAGWLETVENILLVWMWWSWMALTIMKECIEQSNHAVPCRVVKEYRIPKRVSKKTLMIVASYSGNTEETVAAMEQGLAQWATMVAISSWGVLSEFANDFWHTLISIPSWIEPRAALPYSLWAQIAFFETVWLIENGQQQLENLAVWVADHNQKIQENTQLMASYMSEFIPIIYSSQQYEATSLRARQQINENSRMLCRDHQLPEHNHNELLWRQEGDSRVCVLWIIDNDDDSRTQKRIMLTKQVLSERAVPSYEIHMHWSTFLEKTLSAIVMIDWLSFYLAEEKWVDPSWMEIIEWLKWEMKR